jgi:integrase
MNTQMTLGEFLDYWLSNAIKNNVRQSTYTAYRGYIENHIKRHIGTEPLKRLKAERLQALVTDLKNGDNSAEVKFATNDSTADFAAKYSGDRVGNLTKKCVVMDAADGCALEEADNLGHTLAVRKPAGESTSILAYALAAKTVRSIFFMLRGALKFAAECGYIAKDPCAGVRLPRQEEKEIKAFSKREQNKLQAAIERSQDTRNVGVLISLYTGLRIGEVCALKWTVVDFIRGELSVKLSLNRERNYDNRKKRTAIVEVEPKTKKSRRTIPLPKFLCRMLKHLKGVSKSDYVISMKSGKAVEPRIMQKIYKNLLWFAKIEYVGFHTLRHTFATRAIELGADVKTISEVLGHANTMITVNRYTHSLMEQKRKMMKGFDIFYRQNTPG